MLKAGVFGAAGYAGIECVRILIGHPSFELVYVASDSDAGHRVDEVYPALRGSCDLSFSPVDIDRVCEECDIAFLAVPHTASLTITPRLIEAGLIVIDLSADYRLHDPAVYEAWYKTEHTSTDLLAGAVYGLPEKNRGQLETLKSADRKLVACAGCYPTASALAALPVLTLHQNTSDTVISDCLSGVSGAGRSLSRKACFVQAHESVCAYGVATHRHTPEIAQTLTEAAGRKTDVIFTPHLVPLIRGLLSTVYIAVDPSVGLARFCEEYETYFSGEPFVTVLPEGQMPQTADVAGSNRAQIGLALDVTTSTLIASCAIDNLMKGAAGQAVQCANIVCGFPETEGLLRMYPPVV